MTLSRAIAVAAILIVVAIVAAAFFTIGPPSRARAEALDRQRLRDLGDVAAELHEDYSAAPLPAEPPQPRHDPVSGKPYDYRRLGNSHYQLCATFDLPTPPSEPADPDVTTFWRHPAGRFCYTLDAGSRVESTL
ncbi:MAG TPA: hypothetical protein VKR56_07930 [Candidatus Cybelea sp.]|nr:hypothetical protein [Candidatus Cybelea sp.]